MMKGKLCPSYRGGKKGETAQHFWGGVMVRPLTHIPKVQRAAGQEDIPTCISFIHCSEMMISSMPISHVAIYLRLE